MVSKIARNLLKHLHGNFKSLFTILFARKLFYQFIKRGKKYNNWKLIKLQNEPISIEVGAKLNRKIDFRERKTQKTVLILNTLSRNLSAVMKRVSKKLFRGLASSKSF